MRFFRPPTVLKEFAIRADRARVNVGDVGAATVAAGLFGGAAPAPSLPSAGSTSPTSPSKFSATTATAAATFSPSVQLQQLLATETAGLFGASSSDAFSPALYTSAFTMQLAQQFGPAIVGYANRLAAENGSPPTETSTTESTDTTSSATTVPATTRPVQGTQYTFDPFAPAADTQREWGYDPFASDASES